MVGTKDAGSSPRNWEVDFEALRTALARERLSLSAAMATPDWVSARATITISGGRVEQVFQDASLVPNDIGFTVELPWLLAPGFVDMHTHGAFGFDTLTSAGDAAAFEAYRERLATTGTTSFCPTLATAHVQRLAETASSLLKGEGGSRVLGVHYEGPFLNPARKGAQDLRYLLTPDSEIAGRLFEASQQPSEPNRFKTVFTLAPELRGAIELAQELAKRGAIVSAGHSDADYSTAAEAFRSGFSHVTHLYNAMRPMSHHDPGIIGAALSLADVGVDVVMDGHHVDPSVILSTIRTKSPEKVTGITDSLLCAGLPEGVYDFGGRGIVVEGGVAKLTDGTVAGSTVFLKDELLVGTEKVGATVFDSLKMLTRAPSLALRLPEVGEIREGAFADFAVLDKASLTVLGSVIGGKQLYIASPQPGEKWRPKRAMYEEIYEQPSRVRATLSQIGAPALAGAEMILRSKPRVVYLVGSGTSYHAALAARFALTELAGVQAVPIAASEFPNWIGPSVTDHSVVIAISQSGESLDTVNAVRHARAMGFPVVCVTNKQTSTISQLANLTLEIRAGEERAVTATKSYTCTLVALYSLALELGFANGRLPSEKFFSLKSRLLGIPEDLSETIIECDWMAKRAAAALVKFRAAFAMGTGQGYAAALEAALKMKEAANFFAEGFATREFLHGPMQLLSSETCVLILNPAEPGPELLELIQRFKKFGSATVAVMPKRLDNPFLDYLLPLPVAPPSAFTAAFLAVPAQLLAYYLAVDRGLNPDSPDKLSKVVGA
jgi:N-acetylglucosamine-6-phosphate deacetylase